MRTSLSWLHVSVHIYVHLRRIKCRHLSSAKKHCWTHSAKALIRPRHVTVICTEKCIKAAGKLDCRRWRQEWIPIQLRARRYIVLENLQICLRIRWATRQHLKCFIFIAIKTAFIHCTRFAKGNCKIQEIRWNCILLPHHIDNCCSQYRRH